MINKTRSTSLIRLTIRKVLKKKSMEVFQTSIERCQKKRSKAKRPESKKTKRMTKKTIRKTVKPRQKNVKRSRIAKPQKKRAKRTLKGQKLTERDMAQNEQSGNIFDCKLCFASFDKSSALGGHMSKQHPGESEAFNYKKQVRQERELQRLLQKEAINQATLDFKANHNGQEPDKPFKRSVLTRKKKQIVLQDPRYESLKHKFVKATNLQMDSQEREMSQGCQDSPQATIFLQLHQGSESNINELNKEELSNLQLAGIFADKEGRACTNNSQLNHDQLKHHSMDDVGLDRLRKQAQKTINPFK